jgi:hypothetical protein
MDSWGSQDILAGFEPADPRSNRGESVKTSSLALVDSPFSNCILNILKFITK